MKGGQQLKVPYPDLDGTQACAQVDPELFFPHGSAPGGIAVLSEGAALICRRCPFLRPCLAYAISTDVVGVWGGTTYAERERIRKQHGIEADQTGLVHYAQVRQSEVVEMKRGGGCLHLRSPADSASASTPSTPTSTPTGRANDHHRPRHHRRHDPRPADRAGR